jgi:hypothetical protein
MNLAVIVTSLLKEFGLNSCGGVHFPLCLTWMDLGKLAAFSEMDRMDEKDEMDHPLPSISSTPSISSLSPKPFPWLTFRAALHPID